MSARWGAYGPKRFTDRKPIQQRPAQVQALTCIGHRELNTVRPACGTGVLVTMNERLSGLPRLGWSACGRAEDVAVVVASRLMPLERQYFPRSCDFSSISPDELQRLEDLLNNRQRERLQFLTPPEVFFDHKRVAL